MNKIADGLTTHDLGNNESRSTGTAGPDADGMYTALTGVESARFKTARGAGRWLARRGYNPNGTRIAPAQPTSPE